MQAARGMREIRIDCEPQKRPRHSPSRPGPPAWSHHIKTPNAKGCLLIQPSPQPHVYAPRSLPRGDMPVPVPRGGEPFIGALSYTPMQIGSPVAFGRSSPPIPLHHPGAIRPVSATVARGFPLPWPARFPLSRMEPTPPPKRKRSPAIQPHFPQGTPESDR
jgi:hypothetical protein